MFFRKARWSPKVSVVVASYQMQRELPRTVYSIASDYQNWNGADGRVIVIDNGSIPRITENDIVNFSPSVPVILQYANVGPSPLPAINQTLSNEDSEWFCIILDGARMWSPGVIQRFIESAKKYPGIPNGPMAWHLGPVHQSLASTMNYNQLVEDGVLSKVGWQTNGYRLFEISCLAGANSSGYFGSLNEATALFVSSNDWHQIGGFDVRFTSPGGGYGCLDLFKRVISINANKFVVHLGEGTFHQIHGGISTGSGSPHGQWQEEYHRNLSETYSPPTVDLLHVGEINSWSKKFAT